MSSTMMDLDMDPEPIPSSSKSQDMDLDSPNGSPAPPVPPKTRPPPAPSALGKSHTLPAVLPSSDTPDHSPSKPRPKLHSFFGNLRPRNLNRERSSTLIELPKTSTKGKGRPLSRDDDDDTELNSSLLQVPQSGGSGSGNSPAHYNQHNYFPSSPAPRDSADSLSAYISAAFRWALLFLLLWTAYTVLSALVNDISERIHATSLQSRSALHECSRHFEQNCMPPKVSEWALREGLCDDWRICMERDPRMVGRARIAAEILAEMIDAFISGMGWKTLGFLLAISAIFASFTSGSGSKASPYNAQQHSPIPPDYSMAMMSPHRPPFTPHRTKSAPPPRADQQHFYDQGSPTPASKTGRKGWFG